MQKKMKKMRLLCALVSLLFIVAGCRAGNTSGETGDRMVTGISVTYENGPLRLQRNYTAPEKTRAILNYLRWIDPYGTPEEDPTQAEGSLIRIVMQFTDGDQKVYLQKADRYMQVQGQPWKNINPVKAMTLGKMLGQMESDDL